MGRSKNSWSEQENIRSYLGESMPLPELPTDAVFQGQVHQNGEDLDHWLKIVHDSRFHIYTAGKIPRRLIEEYVVGDVSSPIMTYELRDFQEGAPDDDMFSIPKPFTRDVCKRHTGGFPYLHLFSWYLRFWTVVV